MYACVKFVFFFETHAHLFKIIFFDIHCYALFAPQSPRGIPSCDRITV